MKHGDRMTRDVFDRAFDATPNLKLAELIEGVVMMPSSIPLRHGSASAHLSGWLGVYEAATPGTTGGAHAHIRMDSANEPQPNALLLIEPDRGGQAKISADDYVEGAPELIGEVSSDAAGFAVPTKLCVYRRNRVQEYIVWRVLDRAIDWFVFDAGTFRRHAPDADDILRSRVFPGLWLDGNAMVSGDLAKVLAVLQLGIASPEHAAFVQRLQSSGRP